MDSTHCIKELHDSSNPWVRGIQGQEKRALVHPVRSTNVSSEPLCSPSKSTPFVSWLQDLFKIRDYDPDEGALSDYCALYPRVASHLLRSLNDFSSGTIKFCKSCGFPHWFEHPSGSIFSARSQGITTQRVKMNLSNNIADCPHHYMVFTLPHSLRSFDWQDITKLRRAVLKTLKRVVGGAIERISGSIENSTGRGWWGAWCAPHAYGSEDLSWHPHLNVVLTTHWQVELKETNDRNRRSQLKMWHRVACDYSNILKVYAACLAEEFGEWPTSKLGVPLTPEEIGAGQEFKIIEDAQDVINNLVGYGTSPPLPAKIKLSAKSITYTIPHGSKKQPSQTTSLDLFLLRLNNLVPPKHYRSLSRWGIYHPVHKARSMVVWVKGNPENLPIPSGVEVKAVKPSSKKRAESYTHYYRHYFSLPYPVLNPSVEKKGSCKKCDGALQFVAHVTSHRVIKVGWDSFRVELESMGFIPNDFIKSWESFFQSLTYSKIYSGLPPPVLKTISTLKHSWVECVRRNSPYFDLDGGLND